MGAFSIRADKGKSRIIIKRTGDVSRDDLLRVFLNLFSNPLFKQGASILWDLREGSAQALRAQDFYDVVYEAREARANRPEVGPSSTKGAVIVSSKIDFGLSRQFLTLWGTEDSAIEIFEDEDEAIRWLDQPDE